MAALGLLLAAAAGGAAVPDCKLVAGWQQRGPARSYSADNLFEYMDGNAEGYLIYGFSRMEGVTCTRGEDTLIIDISEMADEDAAYGIFTANRHPETAVAQIGMGGQIQPRKASFAKGRFYVEVSAEPEKDHRPALNAFAAALEKTISGRTTLPEALAWFPKEQLTSLRLVPESVLGMRALKRGYVAEYPYGKAFVAMEQSPAAAAAVLQSLRGRLGQAQPVQVAEEAFTVTDRYLGRLCFFRKGRYVAGFANVNESAEPLRLAGALAQRLP
jgi:hypothetical protein